MSFSNEPSPQHQRQMQNAIHLALQNFRYFARELMWDGQRPEKKVDFNGVLCTFSEEQNGEVVSEKVWLGEVFCDGAIVQGQVITAPSQLTSIEHGGWYQVNLKEIDDWIYVYEGKAYGGYTVNLLRSRMNQAERHRHDIAWGFDFGDPLKAQAYPEKEEQRAAEEDLDVPPPTKFFGMTIKPRSKKKVPTGELEMPDVNLRNDHPMAVLMEESFKAYYAGNPDVVHALNERGWTLLHVNALAGNRNIIKILLELGANPLELTPNGRSAKDMAKALGWAEVVSILSKAEREAAVSSNEDQ